MTVLGATGLYDWLLLVHVLGAMVWLGGLVCLSVLAGRVLRASERDAVARFVAALRVVGPVSLAPASIAVVGFGVWLVIDSDAWDFGQTWVILALAVFATAFLVGAGFLGRAAVGAQRAAERGDFEDATRHLRRWSWGVRLIAVLLVVATWDMISKPGL